MSKDALLLKLERTGNEYNYHVSINGSYINLPRNKAIYALLQFKLPYLKGKLVCDTDKIQYVGIDGNVEYFILPEVEKLIRDEFMNLQEWIEKIIDKIGMLESELSFEGEI